MEKRITLFGDLWLDTCTAHPRRYLQPGRQYDGITRAFEHFGIEYQPVNVRAPDFDLEQTARSVFDFGASTWWIRAKEGLAFLAWWHKQGYPKPETVVYHFVDLRAPEGVTSVWPIKAPVIDPQSVHGLIDVLFLVNTEQLEQYKQAYQIPRAYFLPQFYVPEVLKPIDTPKVYDVGFVGGMGDTPLHSERTRVLLSLKERLGDRMCIIESGCYGADLALFYSQCKIVLGASIDPDNVAHYTSDRMAYALGCGAFYLYRWFPGCQDLVPVLTAESWRDERELQLSVDYYLAHNELREAIAKRGHQLALERYTHLEVIGYALETLRGERHD